MKNATPFARKYGAARTLILAMLICSPGLWAQNAPSELRQVLDRLEELEKANRELTAEIRTLNERLQTLSGTAPVAAIAAEPAAKDPVPIEERVEVHTREIEEQAQTKVESSQHLPIRLKGMILFNTFVNSKQGGGSEYPIAAGPRGDASGGASLRQSIFGFEYQGPEIMGGGKLHASLLMDFFGGSGQALDQSLRIRTASVQADWRNHSLSMGIDKPLFAPRDPTSLAQVGVSPLTGAGNLWMWIPQLRFEQRFRISEQSLLKAQIALVQTREISSYQAGNYFAEIEPARPGVEGRVEFRRSFAGGRSMELAPGFHISTSHVAHAPVPSRLVSADWLIKPWGPIEITGAFYTGENTAHLGNGGLSRGFDVAGPQQVRPLRSTGAWSQLAFPAGRFVSFHLFSGFQDDRSSALQTGDVSSNIVYGGNIFYNLASNIILSFETSQVRTTYLNDSHRLNNHYDLALGYLF